MVRFIVYLLIVLGAAYTIEPIRKRVAPPTAWVWQHITPYVDMVVNPLKKDLTEREEKAVINRLHDLHNEGRPFPKGAAFQEWIGEAISVGRDPWHHEYWLKVNGATVWVGSDGADGVRGTEDDVLTKSDW